MNLYSNLLRTYNIVRWTRSDIRIKTEFLLSAASAIEILDEKCTNDCPWCDRYDLIEFLKVSIYLNLV